MPFIAHPARVGAADELLGEAQRLLDAESAALADQISCRPNCTACCEHAIYATAAEIRSVRKAVAALPASQQAEIRSRSEAILARLDADGVQVEPSDEFAEQYFLMSEPCPLLFDGTCSVRDQRPLTCRNYIVSSDPEHCRDPRTGQFVRIRRRYAIPRGFVAVSHEFGEQVHLLPEALLAAPPAPPDNEPRRGTDLARLLLNPPSRSAAVPLV